MSARHLLVADLFCLAGGSSTGAERAVRALAVAGEAAAIRRGRCA